MLGYDWSFACHDSPPPPGGTKEKSKLKTKNGGDRVFRLLGNFHTAVGVFHVNHFTAYRSF